MYLEARFWLRPGVVVALTREMAWAGWSWKQRPDTDDVHCGTCCRAVMLASVYFEFSCSLVIIEWNLVPSGTSRHVRTVTRDILSCFFGHHLSIQQPSCTNQVNRIDRRSKDNSTPCPLVSLLLPVFRPPVAHLPSHWHGGDVRRVSTSTSSKALKCPARSPSPSLLSESHVFPGGSRGQIGSAATRETLRELTEGNPEAAEACGEAPLSEAWPAQDEGLSPCRAHRTRGEVWGRTGPSPGKKQYLLQLEVLHITSVADKLSIRAQPGDVGAEKP